MIHGDCSKFLKLWFGPELLAGLLALICCSIRSHQLLDESLPLEKLSSGPVVVEPVHLNQGETNPCW